MQCGGVHVCVCVCVCVCVYVCCMQVCVGDAWVGGGGMMNVEVSLGLDGLRLLQLTLVITSTDITNS